jgi:molybdenum cofactor cytidylyltransferase
MVGIVLGAGASKRLGRPKQTLPFGDTTLLGHVLRAVEGSALERVVLVVGGAAADALASITPARADVVRTTPTRAAAPRRCSPVSTPRAISRP